ncbi:hypothetical protein [Novacetimonas hansenii]|uniref:hypothetical protein n=1 Tax=Novacetimonas hansenii TaxID=436 RepID=UPI0012DAE6E9|nr:hypothetical protein [Novacetimonas hansenii]WEQ58479.1 hypothetical protein LV563_11600 [Novacetimonas hansenii]
MKKESFRGPHFGRKMRRLLKLFRKSFTKKNFMISAYYLWERRHRAMAAPDA